MSKLDDIKDKRKEIAALEKDIRQLSKFATEKLSEDKPNGTLGSNVMLSDNGGISIFRGYHSTELDIEEAIKLREFLNNLLS